MTKARNIILLSSLILFSASACDRNKIPENAPKAISILANDEEKQNIDLKVGDIFNLTVKITPEDAVLNGVTWKTSDESIVTVDEGGKVLAKATGTAIVSVTSTEYSYLTSTKTASTSRSEMLTSLSLAAKLSTVNMPVSSWARRWVMIVSI